MPASETLLSQLENLLNGLIILGGKQEQTTILPNAIVINDAPSGLANYIIVRDPRDGNYITAVKVAGMAYAINDYVNLLFVKGTEPIAFQHGSNSPSGGFKVYQVWESDFGAVALQADATGQIGIGTTTPATKLDIDAGSNTSGIRLRGLAETTEIADFYVGNGGELFIDLTGGNDANQYLDIRTEDNAYGVIIRESDGTGTIFANLFVVDAAADYLNIVINDAASTLGLVITENEEVGIGVIPTLGKLHVGASSGNVTVAIQSPDASQAELRIRRTTGNDGWSIYKVASSLDLRFFLSTVGDMVSLTSTGVGIGTTSPQAKLHTYDTIGGSLHNWKYDGLAGVSQVIIPDGTGDVLYMASVHYVARTSAGSVGEGQFGIIPTNNNDIVLGADTLRFSVSAGGELSCVRQAGAGTIKVNVDVLWI
jgi:hypothetical protein